MNGVFDVDCLYSYCIRKEYCNVKVNGMLR